MTFAERLTDLMAERKLSKLALSKEIGISDRVVGAWAKGENGINLDNAVVVASFFEVSLDYLSGRSDIREMQTKKEPALEISENGRVMLSYFEALSHDEQLLLIGQAQGIQLVKKAAPTAGKAG